MNKPSLLYDTLSKIGKLDSPQINAYSISDPYERPVFFSFRFDQGQPNIIPLYLSLADCVSNFTGKELWIMHRYGWHKNYVIEPIAFYIQRRTIPNQELALTMGISNYRNCIINSIHDVPNLCTFIEAKINEGVFYK